MKESYEWDRTGPEDPELSRWERELAAFRYHPAARPVRRSRLRLAGLAAAAGIVIAALVWWRVEAGSIRVVQAKGVVEINGAAAGWRGSLRQGDRLRTGEGSEAVVRFDGYGIVRLAENSDVSIAEASGEWKRVRLLRGRLGASIHARPFTFRVETQGSTADDMGCEYEIESDAEGAGVLRVREGWVRLRARNVEALVVEGTEATLLASTGPGVPKRPDTPAALGRLAALVSEGSAIPEAVAAEALASARPLDAVTVLNLMWRVPVDQRVLVYERLAALRPPPTGVSWSRFASGDMSAISEWWPYLGFRKSVKLPHVFYAN